MQDKLRGNLLVGQSGGPSAVINASLCGIIEEASRYSQIEHIYGMGYGIEGLLHKNLMIDLTGISSSMIKRLYRTPSSILGTCRYKLKEGEYQKVFDILKAHNIRYLFYIGGGDSMSTAHQIDELAKENGYPLRVMGVPKTIDNDLALTDHCPGYGSAARFNAILTMEVGLDSRAMQTSEPIKIIETMGRNTGWVTAATCLGKRREDDAPHLIYVPERPFVVDKFLSEVEEVYRRIGWVVVAACEGLKDTSGELIAADKRELNIDAFGHPELGGVGEYLTELVKDKLKLKARFDKPGTAQRASMTCVSQVDLEEAYLVGKVAVQQAVKGVSGYMVTLVRESTDEYRCTTGLAKLEEVASKEKYLPDEFINEEANFVTDKYKEYTLPLIGGPLPDYLSSFEELTLHT
ncbi:6-phosphofructokinase [Candidatus Aerophobetes bacterium]|uniref:Pyrophosphate--fructose 6-phosphate 1-phosphotransferase n=1 Tax=Aerophobetes bacterium TaxID=2030807 RepID=A0A497E6N0_UNCAE|nr:MAG: 6-phosphofructokinase [Candidatus Aerophobetes bacterium]